MNFLNKLSPMAVDPLQGTSDKLSNLNNIIKNVNTIISAALGILTAGVVILAIFIAYKFFTADDDGTRKNAKAQLIYAIIGVVVLLALLIFVPTVIDTVKGSL